MKDALFNIGDLSLMPWETCRAKFHRIERLKKEIEGSSNQKLISANQETISGIRKQIVEGNLRLVVMMAKKADEYNFRELIGAGTAGLMRAAEAFNPNYKSSKTNEIRFSTYACNSVFRSISTWRSSQHLVLKHHVVSMRSAYMKARDMVATHQNPNPSLSEIKKYLVDNAPQSVRWTDTNIAIAARTVDQYYLERMDRPKRDSDGSQTNIHWLNHSYIDDNSDSIDGAQLFNRVMGCINNLPDRMQFSIKHWYELSQVSGGARTKFNKLSLEDIGVHLGVSKERVRQIILDAVNVIKAEFKNIEWTLDS